MKKRMTVLALILLVLLGPSLWLNTRCGVVLNGRKLIAKNDSVYEADARHRIVLNREKAEFSILFGQEELEAALAWNHGDVRITYSDGEAVEGRWNGMLTDAEGMPLWMRNEIVISFADEPQMLDRIQLSERLCEIWLEETEAMGSLWAVFLGILFYLWGAAVWLWPEEMYFLLSRWKYNHAELSDDGLLMEKLGGLVMMAVSAGIMFLPLFVQ